MSGLALLTAIFCALPCAAQQGQSPQSSRMAQNSAQLAPQPAVPPDWKNGLPISNTNPRFTAMQLARMNADRQKSMVADANKLLKLTQRLNAEVNGAHASALTQDQLRQVREIEKLAHKVREEMSFADQITPSPWPPVIPMSNVP
jgi:hypothetical protein